MASPVYRQIASGDLAAGSQPSAELVLRQRYSASRNTARDAIKQLTHRPWSMQTSHYPIPADGRIPVHEISRAAFDGNGRPIRLTITVYPVDRHQFVINVGDVPGVKSQDSTGIQPPGARSARQGSTPHRSREERESGQNPAPP